MNKHFIVCAKNGCGDHVSLVLIAKNTVDALNKARLIDIFPKDWDDVSVQQRPEYYSWKYPNWLLDVEEYDHENPYYEPKYYI